MKSRYASLLSIVLLACGAPVDAPDARPSGDAGPSYDGAQAPDSGAPNQPPDAVDDEREVAPVVATDIDVLANDTDPDGDTLVIAAVGDAMYGTVLFDGNHVTYQPTPAYRGTDQFTYQASDGRGGVDTATVRVTITPDPNNAPTPTDDAVETSIDTPVTIDALANDSDPDADALTITRVTTPASGTATTDGASVVYTPAAAFLGVDTFDYEVADPSGALAMATVTVTVIGMPDAVDDAATTVERAPVRIEVLANDTHPSGLALSLDSIGSPSHGVATIDGDAVAYTAELGFVGTDTLTYTVRDPRGSTDTAAITIEVVPGARSAAIAAGGNQSFSIGLDGALRSWGNSNNVVFGNATPMQLGTSTNWTEVTAGRNHACAINADSELYCWADNFYGQLGLGPGSDRSLPTRVGTDVGWTEIAAGKYHTCGIRDGNLFCWGHNANGELGIGTSIDRNTPQLVTGDGRAWTTVAAGDAHTCALRAGELWCWGENSSNQLGDPALFAARTPMRIGTDSDWAWLAAGDRHTCGLKLEGSLFCWGTGAATGAGAHVSTPTRIGTSVGWTDVRASALQTCGIDGGTLKCWGENAWGQLGDGTQIVRTTPQTIGTDTDWVHVAVGEEHACGTRAGGQIYCWGRRRNGQLGDGVLVGSRVPIRVGTDNDWAQVTVGGDVFWNAYGCAVRTDGTLWCWGSHGRTSSTEELPSASPRQVGVDTTWSNVEGAPVHTCATQSDQSLFCWGEGAGGRLGLGDALDQPSPVRVGGTTTYRELATGSSHTCAIATSGALHCWGATGSSSPAPVGADVDWQSVTAGASHTCALRTDGTLWCWPVTAGSVPAQVGADADWSAISAGYGRTCGLRTSGTLWCWNAGAAPAQIGLDADWSMISAHAQQHTCGIRTDGSLWCFGDNTHGQLGDGTTTDRVLPTRIGTDTDWVGVATGAEGFWSAFTCAIKRDGSLWCWGNGDFGQLGQGNAFSTTPVAVME